jgi:hypothetical protein
VEGWLREAALAQVHLALAGQQPLAQHHAGALQRLALDEGAVTGDQPVAHQLGVRQQVHAPLPEAPLRHVAVLAVHPLQERQRVAPEGGQRAQRKAAARAGRLGETQNGGARPRLGDGPAAGLAHQGWFWQQERMPVPMRPQRAAVRKRGKGASRLRSTLK